MRVVLHATYATPDVAVSAGQTVNLPEKEALDLIAGRYARPAPYADLLADQIAEVEPAPEEPDAESEVDEDDSTETQEATQNDNGEVEPEEKPKRRLGRK